MSKHDSDDGEIDKLIKALNSEKPEESNTPEKDVKKEASPNGKEWDVYEDTVTDKEIDEKIEEVEFD